MDDAAELDTQSLATGGLIREALERQRIETELEHRLQAMTLLFRVSTLIASAADLTEALSGTCSELARYLDVPQAGFALLNPERTAAEVVADYYPLDGTSARGTIIPVAGNPSMAHFLENKTPLAILEAQSDPLLRPIHAVMRQRNVQSILIVPVIVAGEVIGTLGFDSFEPHSFTQTDIDLVQHVANQAGQVLVRKRTELTLARRAREMEALYETTLEINAQPDLTTLLEAIVHRAADLVGVGMGGLYLMQPDGETLELAVGTQIPESILGARLRLGEGLAGRVAQTRQPMMVPDYSQWEGRSPIFDGHLFRRALGVPLQVGDRFIGVLDLTDDREAGSFDDNQVRLAILFADQAALAMENARLLAAERTAREQTEALRQAAQAMGASLDVDQILRLILDQLRRVLVYDSASVLVLREGEEPDLIVGIGYADGEYTSREARRLLRQSPILHRMSESLQPVVCADVRQLEGWVWVPGADHVRSWMAVPLVSRGSMIGALMVDHTVPGFYTESDLQVALALGQHAAQALENARLYQERVAAERQLRERQLYLEAVLAAVPDAIVTLDAQHRLVEWNRGAERLFGYSQAGVKGRQLDDLITNADTIEEASDITRQVLRGEEVHPRETIRHRRDGSPVDVLLAGSPILVDGELRGIVGVYTDISQRVQAERAQRKANRGLEMLSRSNSVLSRVRSEADLLGEICRIVVDSGGYRSAWVGYAERDLAMTVRPAAQAGFEEEHLESVKVSWADAGQGGGPAGTAIRTRMPVIARDTLSDPVLAPWGEDAARQGYASSIALPLHPDGETYGVLMVYAREPDAFDVDEIYLLMELADNLSYGIAVQRTRAERIRAEEGLRRYAQRLETLHRIDRAIVEAQSPEAIAQATLARIGQLVPFKRARITSFGSRTNRPGVLAEHAGAAGPAPSGAGDTFGAEVPAPVQAPTEATIPLVAGGELIGTLNLESVTHAGFTPEQVEVIYEVAAPLAVSIDHARLHEQLRRYAGSLEEAVAQRTRELRTERDRTQAILESLGEAVVVTDIEGTVLYTNPASDRLTGFAGEDAVGQNWQRLHGEGPVAQAFSQAQQALRRGETWRAELVHRRKDGASYDVAITAAPLVASEDPRRVVGCVWVERDITPLKEAERIKDQFVSDVSHELRTPLSIMTLVAGNLDRLYDRLADEKRQEMIRSLRGQVGLLSDLIGDILEISRIDSKTISMHRLQVDLVPLVREEVEKQALLARRKGQTVDVTGAEMLRVSGNERQLRQVIRNLLDNAVKFTPHGGRITCECLVKEGGGRLGLEWPGGQGLPPGRWATLHVVDTGIGIEPQSIPHLFERFYRVETQGNIPGTGLGLAITRELVELHGGHVGLATTPGQGSLFAVHLPLVEEEV